MSYIITTEHHHFSNTTVILGIYNTLEEAEIIYNEYINNNSLEIVNIHYLAQNLTLNNINIIKIRRNENGEIPKDFIQDLGSNIVRSNDDV